MEGSGEKLKISASLIIHLLLEKRSTHFCSTLLMSVSDEVHPLVQCCTEQKGVIWISRLASSYTPPPILFYGSEPIKVER